MFGVYAEQIEELLETRNIAGGFAPAGDMTIEYDARQIQVIHCARWLKLESCRDTRDVLLSDSISLEDGSPASLLTLNPTSPRILIVRCKDGSYKGIWVKHLIRLLTVPIEQIHALPALMEQNKLIEGMWGLMFVEKQLIILLDLEQIS